MQMCHEPEQYSKDTLMMSLSSVFSKASFLPEYIILLNINNITKIEIHHQG
jgi:hypothetical protein